MRARRSKFWLWSHDTPSSGVVDSRHEYLSVFYNFRNQFRQGKQSVHSSHLGYNSSEALKETDPRVSVLSTVTWNAAVELYRFEPIEASRIRKRMCCKQGNKAFLILAMVTQREVCLMWAERALQVTSPWLASAWGLSTCWSVLLHVPGGWEVWHFPLVLSVSKQPWGKCLPVFSSSFLTIKSFQVRKN